MLEHGTIVEWNVHVKQASASVKTNYYSQNANYEAHRFYT